MCVCLRYQCLETLSSRQMEMQLFIADGCKEALLEEKRRFCFLVDKHCMFSYQFANFHDKVQDCSSSCWNQSADFTFTWPNWLCLWCWWKVILMLTVVFLFESTSHTSDSFKSNHITNDLRTCNASCYHSDENVCAVSSDYSCLFLFEYLFLCPCLLDRPETCWRKSWAAGRTSAVMPPTCPRPSCPWSRDCARQFP